MSERSAPVNRVAGRGEHRQQDGCSPAPGIRIPERGPGALAGRRGDLLPWDSGRSRAGRVGPGPLGWSGWSLLRSAQTRAPFRPPAAHRPRRARRRRCRNPECNMAEGVGFEPTVPCGTAVFKTAALSHSATPPRLSSNRIADGRSAW
jgi:hypothetical protein